MLLIREATTTDAEVLQRYLVRLMGEPGHNSPLWPGEFERTVSEQAQLLSAFSTEENSLYLLALEEDEIVGELNLRGYKRKALRHGAFLGMSVRIDFRRKGIGQALLRRGLEWAEAQGLERVDLAVLASNEGAINLYKLHGFVEEGRRKNFVKLPSGYVDDILMVRLLAGAV